MQAVTMAAIGNGTITNLFNNSQAAQNISNKFNHDINLSSTVTIALTTFLSVVIIVSSFGNAAAIILFAVCQELRTITWYFIIGLCTSDLLTTFVTLPFWVSLINAGWPSREDGVAYMVWISMDIFCGCMSIINLSLVSVERYTSIVHSMHYESMMTKKRAIIMIATSVVYSLATATFGYIRMSKNLPFMIIFVLLAAYIVPVSILSYTHWSMFLVTRKHCKFEAEHEKLRRRLNAMEMTELNSTGMSYI